MLVVVFLFIAITKAQAMSTNNNNIPVTRLQLLPVHTLRSDPAGHGAYNADRGARDHKGIDLIAAPGAKITLPVSGRVVKIGRAYATDSRYNSYHIRLANDLVLKLLYVKPLYKVNENINAGAVIGEAQNIAAKYPGRGMLNHIHVEILRNGTAIDPTPFLF